MTSQASLAQQIAQLAGILRDCAAQGLHFSTNVYERDSFAKVQDVGLALLALATDLPEGELEALRTEVFVRPGAFSVGDAAIIDGRGRILLIRRADKWAVGDAGRSVGGWGDAGAGSCARGVGGDGRELRGGRAGRYS